MRRNVWTAEELRDLLGGLAILAPQAEAERRGFILAVASMAQAVGIRPPEGKAQLTDEILKSGFLTGF